MKILKVVFMFIAVAVITGGLTVPLWLDKAFPELTAPNPIPQPQINADSEHIPIILSVLNNTDKNIIEYIKSITVMDNLTELRRICNNSRAFGCVEKTFKNNFLEKNSSIYVASKSINYAPECGGFEYTLYHEIGHVVYSYQYGKIFYSTKRDEEFAISYGKKFLYSSVYSEEMYERCIID